MDNPVLAVPTPRYASTKANSVAERLARWMQLDWNRPTANRPAYIKVWQITESSPQALKRLKRWRNQPDGAVGTCLLTRLAVLRLLSNRVAMNGNPVKPREALAAWQQLADDPRSVHLESEPPTHERRFTALVAGRDPTPNLWTDAWLAALALSLDYEMTTFDRGFKSFRGLRVRLLTPPDR